MLDTSALAHQPGECRLLRSIRSLFFLSRAHMTELELPPTQFKKKKPLTVYSYVVIVGL